MGLPEFIDPIAEIQRVEKTLLEAQERAQAEIIRMSDALGKRSLVFTGRRAHRATQHALLALMEMKSVTDGLVHGVIELLKATAVEGTINGQRPFSD
jgi:hypothetical protein